jgi:uncharacterized protein (TIGR00369 family)
MRNSRLERCRTTDVADAAVRPDGGETVTDRVSNRSGPPRTGPFWDAVAGRVPIPPGAATLGAQVVEADPENGTVVMHFAATEAFTNPLGEVLGAFQAAMLYDTVGPALLATLDPDQFQATLQLNVNFLRPARPGQFTAVGHVVHRAGDIVLLEATLADADDSTIASATAVATVMPLPEVSSSASVGSA